MKEIFTFLGLCIVTPIAYMLVGALCYAIIYMSCAIIYVIGFGADLMYQFLTHTVGLPPIF